MAKLITEKVEITFSRAVKDTMKGGGLFTVDHAEALQAGLDELFPDIIAEVITKPVPNPKPE